MEGSGRSTPGGHTSFQPAPFSHPPGEQAMEGPRPAPWVCSGCVTWGKSPPSLTSVAVWVPGQRAGDSRAVSHRPATLGTGREDVIPGEFTCACCYKEATTITGQVGRAGTEAQRETEGCPRTHSGCATRGLLSGPRPPLPDPSQPAPPTSSCPFLFPRRPGSSGPRPSHLLSWGRHLPSAVGRQERQEKMKGGASSPATVRHAIPVTPGQS